jgi:hypothetical protein
MPKIRIGGNGTAPGSSLWLWCPGCEDAHRIVIGTADSWTWDGNAEAPTISPSILATYPRPPAWGGDRTCHSFVVAGVWQFLGDSTHALAGQNVPMVDLPDWFSTD